MQKYEVKENHLGIVSEGTEDSLFQKVTFFPLYNSEGTVRVYRADEVDKKIAEYKACIREKATPL